MSPSGICRRTVARPPAMNLVVLAGDLMAKAAREVLEVVAFGNFGPAQRLRNAVDAYEQARIGDEITRSEAALDEPVPATLRTGEVDHG